jgi:hypothetical protein
MTFDTIQRQPSPTIVFFARLGMNALEQVEVLLFVAYGTALPKLADRYHSGMSPGVVLSSVVTAMAIRATDSFLPVRIVFERFRRNE